MRATLNAFASLLVTLALTQRLDKPPLEPNLNFIATGFLQSLPSVKNSYTQWPRDWIPVDCESMVENANLSAIDVEVFNVTYDDVGASVDVCILLNQPTDAFMSSVSPRSLDPLPAYR